MNSAFAVPQRGRREARARYRTYIAGVGMVHSPPRHARRQEKTSPVRFFRRPLSDFAVFCMAVTLAVATIAGASAAKRPPAAKQPPLPTVQIAGTVNVLADPGVQQALRRALGVNITTNTLGSEQILARTPLSGYQADYLPTELSAQAVEQRLHSLNLPDEAVTPFTSRLAVATYLPIAQLLRQIGVATESPDGIWTFSLAAYVAAVNRHVHWNDIKGNETGSVYPSDGPMWISTTDPRDSAIAQLFVADASYALNGDQLVTDQATAKRIAKQLSLCFSLQGNMQTDSNTEFADWIGAGNMDADPIILTYENQFVQDELIDERTGAGLLAPGMVLMDVTPVAFDDDTLIATSATGTEVASAFADNPQIRAIAEDTYGFIPAGVTPDEFAQAMASRHVAVAGNLTTDGQLPSAQIMTTLLAGLD
jgi:hypothetical protein